MHKFKHRSEFQQLSVISYMSHMPIDAAEQFFILIVSHLCSWVERGIVRVKCLVQEHNLMSPARVRTQTDQS